MRRREVLTGLLLAGFSTHGEAQGPEKPYRIVILNLTLRADELNEFGPFPQYRAFFQELRRRGFDEKQNLVVVRLSAEGDANRHSQIVGEAVAIHPNAIFAVGTRFMRLLKEVTTTAPVVGIATDPVGHGLIDSLARPGGNMTGVSLDAGVEIVGKRLELLKEIDPRIERVGYLAPQFGWDGLHGEAMERLARTKGITLVGPPLQSPIEAAEYRRVFAAMAEQRAHAVFVSDYAENLGNRHLIATLAAAFRLPSIHALTGFVEVGGLMEYAPDLRDVFSEAAVLISRVLRGENPAEMPFVQPTRFALRLNSKTAKALNLTIPSTLLARADEVIE